MEYHQLLYHLFRAWKNLRRNKTTKSILTFELTHEAGLIQLAQELYTRTYQISPYRCFIIYDPVQREKVVTICFSNKDSVSHKLG